MSGIDLRRGMAAVVIFCSALVIGVPRALAQSTSAAAIEGVVRDTSGAVMPGVTVEATSPALIEKTRATVTDAQGKYQITELRPGTYSVTFSLPGFATLRREGVELTSNFTASVSAELTVGAVTETLTVTAATPLVDVSNVTQQKVVSQELFDTVPTGKTTLSLFALMPAAAAPLSSQDVGGSKGEASVRMSIHGAKQTDQRMMQNGMTYNMVDNPTGRTFYVNPLAAAEIVVEAGSGGSAEYQAGGAQVNLISRDGGNRFSGTIFTSATSHQLQADNLDEGLRAQGLTSVNGVRRIYDLNAVIGGPVIRDTLWFTTSHRANGRLTRIANLYHDSNLSDWLFTPDLNHPVDAPEDLRSHNLRLTWAAKNSMKVSFSYDYQKNFSLDQDGGLSAGTTAAEAATRSNAYCNQPTVTQGTWNYVATNKLLFQVGFSRFHNYQGTGFDVPCGGLADEISVREQSTGFTYHGTSQRWKGDNYTLDTRGSVSYVTGQHNFKAGWDMLSGHLLDWIERGGSTLPVQYTFNNGVPTQLTEWVSPRINSTNLRANLGVFAQDQWRLDRVTLNFGLRYEYLNAYTPDTTEPAGFPIATPQQFAEVDCLPCWHDISPRAAAVYDLFGNGKTALKVSAGRYVEAKNTNYATLFGPSTANVSNTTRSWTDSNKDFYPNCNLSNPLANGECGALANSAFGQQVFNNVPEAGFMSGWGKRGYNWQASVSIDHELRPGLALQAGYYRRWYGNFTVVKNTLVSPSEYDPYCITAPTDSRLGSISGSQVCGFYDIKPAKFGQVSNVTGLASAYGSASEVYNGIDVNLNARFGKRGTVSAGWNLGNTLTTGGSNGLTFSKSNNCFVVNSPQELYNCESQNPYQSRIRINGSYPLPWWGLQVAAVFQSLPGPNFQANYAVAVAAIQPSLGRALSGGVRTVTIDLEPRGAAYLDLRVNQLDLRFTKVLTLPGRQKLNMNLDVYNLLNSNAPLQVNNTFGPSWLQPTTVLDARFIKFSLQYDF